MSRFSRRTPAEFRPNALSRARAACRHPLIDLSIANPTAAGIFEPGVEWLQALTDPRAATYEPEPRGLMEAREAVAGYYAGHGVRVPPESIFLTSSSSESYTWLAKLLCDPGDEILTPQPSYPLFDCLLDLEAVRAVPYPLRWDEGWNIDFDALALACSPRTKALVYVHPNNPTGSYLKRQEAGRLLEFCAARDLALISDEVFYDFDFGPDLERALPLVASAGPSIFSLGGFSKLGGLPQMKFGWIAASASGETLERLEWIADSFLPVSAPVQHAAAPWMRDLLPARRDAIRRRTADSLESLSGTLRPEFRLLRPEGGWCAVIEVPRIHTDEEWALELVSRFGVIVQPGYFYDFHKDGFLVVSLLAALPALEVLAGALGNIIGPETL